MNPADAHNYLNSFINYERVIPRKDNLNFRLERMSTVLGLLGNPQNNYKIIHVAGSKGKGSVCAMTAHILKQAGYSAGLYTSPHIADFKERIRILSPDRSNTGQGLFPDSITDDEFASSMSAIRPVLDHVAGQTASGQLTYFEVLTVLALYFFAQRQADYAVLETGLGGRLDATNVVHSDVCAITAIDLEHTELLGETYQQIAVEKAAIIKQGALAAVISPQKGECLDVIEKRCREQAVPLVLVGRDIAFERRAGNAAYQNVTVTGVYNRYEFRTTLLGAAQAVNAATAVGIIEALRDERAQQAVEEGMAQTVWPGRFEISEGRPMWIFDCAHSPRSSSELADTVRELFPGRKVRLVIGFSSDKKIDVIIQNLKAIAEEIIFTKADHPRAMSFSKESVFKSGLIEPVHITDTTQQAFEVVSHTAGPDDIILVAGSVFVMSELRAILKTKAGCGQKVLA